MFKSDGVLAFSFHHSRAEGWAAIFEAITTAGLVVVAAHPVHAELRAASPKAAAKDPISLDAILVCRKRSRTRAAEVERSAVIQKSVAFANKLQSAGISVSASDRFVILASQMLVALSSTDGDFDSVCDLLKRVRHAAQTGAAGDTPQAARP